MTRTVQVAELGAMMMRSVHLRCGLAGEAV